MALAKNPSLRFQGTYPRELAGFRLARDFPMFICDVISGYKDHESFKFNLFIDDILWDHLKYRKSYHALITLGNKIIAD